MTAPVPHTWVDNEFASAAGFLNPGVRDPMLFLLDPPMCVLRQTVAQSLATATFTSLTFTTEDYDNEPLGMHDPTVSNTRITCRTAGRYFVTSGVGFVSNATGRRGLRVLLNGAAVNASQIVVPATGSSGFGVAGRSVYVPMSVGDYLELQAYQDSPAALSTDVVAAVAPSFSARWSSP